jgi:hypothetical protein
MPLNANVPLAVAVWPQCDAKVLGDDLCERGHAKLDPINLDGTDQVGDVAATSDAAASTKPVKLWIVNAR